MSRADDRERLALIEEIKRERWKAAVRGDLFDLQLRVIDDPAQFKAVHPGRRSGKSTGMPHTAVLLALDAGFNEVVILAAETQKKAKSMHWASLHALCVKHGLPFKSDANSGEWVTPWGSKIVFWGLNDSGAVELLRGFKLAGALFDEVATYAHVLTRLISEIIEPALGDTGGPCTLFGTPSVTCVGPWANICRKVTPGWSVHHWDVRQNKKFPKDAESFLQQKVIRNGWVWDRNDPTKTTPTFAREYLGLFVNDVGMQVFAYDVNRNAAECLPTKLENGTVTIGVDYGTTTDACAWVVVWSAKGSRDIYVLEAQQHHGMLPDDAADVTRALMERWNPSRVVGDSGGLGAPYVLAFNRRYGHLSGRWVQPADKQGRLGQIAIVNGELGSGRVRTLPAAQPLADALVVLPWKNEKREEIDAAYKHLTHYADSFRYAVYAHLTDVPPPPPPEPTAEELAQRALEERQARARAAKEEEVWL